MDQPLLLCSYANAPMAIPCGEQGSTCSFQVTGLFCALSLDDGALLPHACIAQLTSSDCCGALSQVQHGPTCAL
jgi:hypothetical protein